MIVHRLSLQLVSEIHCQVMPLARRGDAELADQLHRASRSVALNISEGLGVMPGKRQRNHFRIALGSGREVYTCLELLAATGIVGEGADEVRALSDRVNKMLYSLAR